MKTWPLTTEDGRLRGFEIDAIRRERILRIVADIPGAALQATAGAARAELCRFALDGQLIIVREAGGARFLVESEPAGWNPRLAQVHAAFAGYCL